MLPSQAHFVRQLSQRESQALPPPLGVLQSAANLLIPMLAGGKHTTITSGLPKARRRGAYKLSQLHSLYH